MFDLTETHQHGTKVINEVVIKSKVELGRKLCRKIIEINDLLVGLFIEVIEENFLDIFNPLKNFTSGLRSGFTITLAEFFESLLEDKNIEVFWLLLFDIVSETSLLLKGKKFGVNLFLGCTFLASFFTAFILFDHVSPVEMVASTVHVAFWEAEELECRNEE